MNDELKMSRDRMIAILNQSAQQIIDLSKMSEKSAMLDIIKKTGCLYIAEKYDRFFAAIYLNCDESNKCNWMKYFGIDSNYEDVEYMRIMMIYFNNNSIENFTTRYKIDLFGTGENWCSLWVLLGTGEKEILVNQILNWDGY